MDPLTVHCDLDECDRFNGCLLRVELVPRFDRRKVLWICSDLGHSYGPCDRTLSGSVNLNETSILGLRTFLEMCHTRAPNDEA